MKLTVLVVLFGLTIGVGVVYFLYPKSDQPVPSVPEIIDQIVEKPLEKYSIDRLSETPPTASTIEIGEIISEEENFTSYVFYYYVDDKKVSGQLNVPNEESDYPVIVMFRGYAPVETYTTGVGTRRGAEYFANNGFITIAPDFLGYGESDNPSTDIFEARFQTYTTAATLLSSVTNLDSALKEKSINVTTQPNKVGIWGHSNGGQVAITTLEITQGNYPTVLWAPVSKPFPYSILYYTDEADDYGKAIRKKLADFEENYDADKYNVTTYLEKINSPIQLHQGTIDEEVPVIWSNELVDKLEELEKDVEYFTYAGADHNLMPTGWNPAIARAVEFYTNHFTETSEKLDTD